MRFVAGLSACFAVIYVLLVLSTADGQLNKKQHKRLKTKVARIILKNKHLVPRLVQLAFHDCIGGCDGCVNTADPNNGNLATVVALAEEFREENAPKLSQADINVLISIEALEYTARQANGRLDVPLRIGRKDCDRSNGFPVRTFAHGRGLDSLRFLRRSFGVNTREAVALLGVHTLGRCNAGVSGYEGPWDSTQLALDNKYYKNMIQSGWVVEQRDELPIVRSSQWTKNRSRKSSTMMLHADMIMYKNFTTAGDFDTPSCEFDDCPLSDTADIVTEFAAKQKKFHKELEVAFRKMVDGNGDGLKRIQ